MTRTAEICVSVAEPDPATCAAALAGLPCAEVRLDAMAVTVADVRSLFGRPGRLVATCRPGRHDDETRQRLLLAAIEAGAAFVDVELDAAPASRDALVAAARARGCCVIVSHHDHGGTPPRAELDALRARCRAAGADWVKLACWVEHPADAARLLGLYDRPDGTPLVVVGMGPRGRIVRLVAPLLGSPLAYAARGPGQQTAPGQPSRAELERWLEEWPDG